MHGEEVDPLANAISHTQGPVKNTPPEGEAAGTDVLG